MKITFYCFGILFDAFVKYVPGTENTFDSEGDPEEIEFLELRSATSRCCALFLLNGDLCEQLEEAACAVARTMEKDCA